MNIGGAAADSGVSAKMIRHYEAIGLLRPAPRRANSYRDYSEHDVHELRFIARARKLGFSIDEIRDLLALWRDGQRPSAEVRRIAQRHLDDLDRRIAEMADMADSLRALVRACRGDSRPDCPILADLSRPPPSGGPAKARHEEAQDTAGEHAEARRRRGRGPCVGNGRRRPGREEPPTRLRR